MIESASNTSRRRREVWLARMRQRDACWVGEVTLKGSRIVSEPAPCARASSRCTVRCSVKADFQLKFKISKHCTCNGGRPHMMSALGRHLQCFVCS